MSNKYIKWYIREKQIKLRYNFTSISMATIKMIEIITKDFENKSVGKDVEKLEFWGSMVGI